MKIKSGIRRITLAAGGAGVVVGMAIAVPGIASASIGPGNIELCANGNYAAQLDFEGPIEGGAGVKQLFTNFVPQGTCQVFGVPSFSSTEITIGRFNTNPSTFKVGASVAQAGRPAQLIRAKGTTTAPIWEIQTF